MICPRCVATSERFGGVVIGAAVLLTVFGLLVSLRVI
jgi:hypothetical protein